MYCENCGEKMNKEAKFCRKCGSEVSRENDFLEKHKEENALESKSSQENKSFNFKNCYLKSALISSAFFLIAFTSIDLFGNNMQQTLLVAVIAGLLCGAAVALIVKEFVKDKITNKDNYKEKTSSNIADKVLGVFIVFFAISIAKFLGFIAFIFLVAYLLGQWFPKWYFKRDQINWAVVKFIAWSNLLTWILPPMGILTGTASFEFYKLLGSENKKYKYLALFSIIFSVLNAITGILISNK
jgi:ribosomal protein L40E